MKLVKLVETIKNDKTIIKEKVEIPDSIIFMSANLHRLL